MKRFLIVVLIVILALGLMACGKSLREKQAEQMVEEMFEKMGEDVDFEFDEDGNEVSMSMSDGENEMVIEGDEGGMAWPNEIPAYVPQPKGIKVVGTQKILPAISIFFEDCSEAAARAYKGEMEANGWKVMMETEMEGTINIQATIDDKEVLTFSWDDESGSGVVVYSTDE